MLINQIYESVFEFPRGACPLLPGSRVTNLKSVAGYPISMNTNPYLRLLLIVLAGGSTEVSDIFGNEDAQTPFALLRDKDLRDEVSNLLEVLDDRERKIIFQRFALDGGKSKTLEEVAQKFGFTRKRIRQLQSIALVKLRLRIQSYRTLHRILVVFVMGLVLRIKEQPFLVKPITFPRLVQGFEESQSKTGVKKWQGK